MTRRKPTKYVPPPPENEAPASNDDARHRRDPLAFLDDLAPILTVEEAAAVLRRDPRAYLDDPKTPRLPLNRKEIRVLRESLREYLEERMGVAQAAFIASVKECPTLLDDATLAGLLDISVADASVWAAGVRGVRAAD
ncbi:MAG: hypothetical protein O9319_00200 [Gemmatimonas sp.]|uniref:hypothetical protein n=1 Tax=Gemmatimonas sp. TaxID=1962908 RepID=UPI0022C4A9FA|nr:hypothetical protein [Gemmatimonas sp.]MCZ8013988.1 hypothetical protein [Gemmatimonas sp.]MCZ8265250.1 hypothetical protein [Gemmatimonas sp.]